MSTTATPYRTIKEFCGWQARSIVCIRAHSEAAGRYRLKRFGLFARYPDANNYYYVTVRNSDEISLRRQLNGSVLTLDTAVAQGRYGAIMYKPATAYDDVTVTQPWSLRS